MLKLDDKLSFIELILIMLDTLYNFKLEYFAFFFAFVRIFLELTRYQKGFRALNNLLNKRKRIHALGLYLSIGYIIIFALELT